ncbi:hypothetical protein ACODT5_01040 [Streptomyces sp. 5.8]|uniref:hypothetical protein n=1 Tax=Streptomyces sp. 5.8 TaxID=3406571 RepID=UPI003BB5D087
MDSTHRPGERGIGRCPMAAVIVVTGLLVATAGFAGPSAAARPATVLSGLAWGQPYTYANGLAVTVVPPTPFSPSDTSAGHQAGNQAVAWKITVKNGTPELFPTSPVSVYAKYGTAGEQAERVYDSAKGADSDFEGSIAPGRSATVTYVFDVPRAGLALLDLEVVPDAAVYEGTHWSGALAP